MHLHGSRKWRHLITTDQDYMRFYGCKVCEHGLGQLWPRLNAGSCLWWECHWRQNMCKCSAKKVKHTSLYLTEGLMVTHNRNIPRRKQQKWCTWKGRRAPIAEEHRQRSGEIRARPLVVPTACASRSLAQIQHMNRMCLAITSTDTAHEQK